MPIKNINRSWQKHKKKIVKNIIKLMFAEGAKKGEFNHVIKVNLTKQNSIIKILV